MNCNPTLTAEEFRVLHNTLWDLDRLGNPAVQGLVERIRRVALKGAYEQDNQAFTRKHDHYDQVREDLGLRSRWSLYEVDNLSDPHPYTDAEFMVYDNHWGGDPVVVKIPGPTWGDLYRAADAAIQASGDGHHCFIESFTPIEDRPEHLRLGTGS